MALLCVLEQSVSGVDGLTIAGDSGRTRVTRFIGRHGPGPRPSDGSARTRHQAGSSGGSPRSCVHIQPDTRTLKLHWGLRHLVALPARTNFLTATHVHMSVRTQPPIPSKPARSLDPPRESNPVTVGYHRIGIVRPRAGQ